MSEPWFDPAMYSWMPGTAYGTLVGTLGALAGTLAPRGKARRLMLGLWWFFIAVAVLFLATSVIAFFSGQPYGIWYGLGLPGVLGIILMPTLLPTVIKRYREAEERKMQAMDLS